MNPFMRRWISAAMLGCFCTLAAGTLDSKAGDYTVALLKGPSGIGASWMMSSPLDLPGMSLRFKTAASADLAVAKLVSGEYDAATLPVNVAVKLFNAGVPLKAVAVVGEGMTRFLTTDPSVRSMADLRGSTIHIAGQKATPDFLFRYLASKAGLAAGKDYTPVYSLSYPEIASMLAAGKIRSAVLPEPFATMALALKPELGSPLDLDFLWREATGLPSYPMTIFVANARLASFPTAARRSFSDAFAASIARTKEEPAATGILAEKLGLGIPAAVSQKAIPVSAYVFKSMAEARPEVEALLKVFLAFDPSSIGGKLPDSDFYGSFF